MKTMTVLRCLGLSFGILAGAALRVEAHGELHELIQRATQDIEKNPNDPILYVRRAELHRAHMGWDSAMADVERAASLTNQWPQLNLIRATLYLDAQWAESAVVAATRYLHHDATNGLALLTRARARAKLGQNLEAAEDFTLAIKHALNQGPELYLERAQALGGAGGTHVDDALRGLDEGMNKLGAVVTLQLAAIDLELKQKRVDAALSRLDRVMAQFPRKETWLARRGEILRQAGRNAEAAQSYQAALKALEELPASRRALGVFKDLETQVRQALAELNPPR